MRRGLMGKINDLRENGYRGPKPFQVDYLNGFGKRKRIHFKTQKEAERFLTTIEAEVLKAKEGLVPDWYFPKEDLTVRELYNRYAKEKIDLIEKETAQKTAKRHLNGMVNRFGDTKVSELTNMGLGQYRIEWRKSGKAENSFQTYIKKFKAMLSWGVKNGYLAKNPLNEYELEKGVKAKEKKPLDKDQIKHFMLALKDEYREELDYFILGVNTGMRIRELWTLEWNQIDIDKHEANLPEEKTKTGEARMVPLNSACMDVINRLYPKQPHRPYVLWHPTNMDGIGKRIKKLSKRFLGKPHTPHFWRVTWATLALEGKEIEGKDGKVYPVAGDLKAVAEIGGWKPKSPVLLNIYHKVSDRRKRQVANLVDIGEADAYPEPSERQEAVQTDVSRLTLNPGNA
jgi:integrase